MKRIETRGISYIEPLKGSLSWYWGTDYTSGDLYEAEELFHDGHPVSQNKLIFVHYPDGRTVQPIVARQGQYFGRPIFCRNAITILMVDFPAGTISIKQFDETRDQMAALVEIPLSAVEDCYNLMLKTAPLMLTRHGKDDQFQIVWPERVSFHTQAHEAFLSRSGERLYFSSWEENPEYREEIIVRNLRTGEIIERIPGSLMVMPDGQTWILA